MSQVRATDRNGESGQIQSCNFSYERGCCGVCFPRQGPPWRLPQGRNQKAQLHFVQSFVLGPISLEQGWRKTLHAQNWVPHPLASANSWPGWWCSYALSFVPPQRVWGPSGLCWDVKGHWSADLVMCLWWQAWQTLVPRPIPWPVQYLACLPWWKVACTPPASLPRSLTMPQSLLQRHMCF